MLLQVCSPLSVAGFSDQWMNEVVHLSPTCPSANVFLLCWNMCRVKPSQTKYQTNQKYRFRSDPDSTNGLTGEWWSLVMNTHFQALHSSLRTHKNQRNHLEWTSPSWLLAKKTPKKQLLYKKCIDIECSQHEPDRIPSTSFSLLAFLLNITTEKRKRCCCWWLSDCLKVLWRERRGANGNRSVSTGTDLSCEHSTTLNITINSEESWCARH